MGEYADTCSIKMSRNGIEYRVGWASAGGSWFVESRFLVEFMVLYCERRQGRRVLKGEIEDAWHIVQIIGSAASNPDAIC